MIKKAYRKNKGVLAALYAAQAWRGAAVIAGCYDISNKQELLSFYRRSMRNWAKYAIKRQTITRHD
jgi:hypothetical protein